MASVFVCTAESPQCAFHDDDDDDEWKVLVGHDLLDAPVCLGCHQFYQGGIGWERDDDGRDMYCRWCAEGGVIRLCDKCPRSFCKLCIDRNGPTPNYWDTLDKKKKWVCFVCDGSQIAHISKPWTEHVEGEKRTKSKRRRSSKVLASSTSSSLATSSSSSSKMTERGPNSKSGAKSNSSSSSMRSHVRSSSSVNSGATHADPICLDSDSDVEMLGEKSLPQGATRSTPSSRTPPGVEHARELRHRERRERRRLERVQERVDKAIKREHDRIALLSHTALWEVDPLYAKSSPPPMSASSASVEGGEPGTASEATPSWRSWSPPQVLSFLKSRCPLWVKTTTFTSHTRPISHKQRISFTFQNFDGSMLKSLDREKLFDMFGVHERLLQKEILGAVYELTGRELANDFNPSSSESESSSEDSSTDSESSVFAGISDDEHEDDSGDEDFEISDGGGGGSGATSKSSRRGVTLISDDEDDDHGHDADDDDDIEELLRDNRQKARQKRRRKRKKKSKRRAASQVSQNDFNALFRDPSASGPLTGEGASGDVLATMLARQTPRGKGPSLFEEAIENERNKSAWLGPRAKIRLLNKTKRDADEREESPAPAAEYVYNPDVEAKRNSGDEAPTFVSTHIEHDDVTRALARALGVPMPSLGAYTPPKIPAGGVPECARIILIFGGSGSGKTSALRHFGDPSSADLEWDPKSSIVSLGNFRDEKTAMDALQSIGFNTVPSWFKPFPILSQGEKYRAKLARMHCAHVDALKENPSAYMVLDEFTSNVDRSVAKSTSASLSKWIRRQKSRAVFASTNADIVPYLQPDVIISLARGREPQIEFNPRSFVKNSLPHEPRLQQPHLLKKALAPAIRVLMTLPKIYRQCHKDLSKLPKYCRVFRIEPDESGDTSDATPQAKKDESKSSPLAERRESPDNEVAHTTPSKQRQKSAAAGKPTAQREIVDLCDDSDDDGELQARAIFKDSAHAARVRARKRRLLTEKRFTHTKPDSRTEGHQSRSPGLEETLSGDQATARESETIPSGSKRKRSISSPSDPPLSKRSRPASSSDASSLDACEKENHDPESLRNSDDDAALSDQAESTLHTNGVTPSLTPVYQGKKRRRSTSLSPGGFRGHQANVPSKGLPEEPLLQSTQETRKRFLSQGMIDDCPNASDPNPRVVSRSLSTALASAEHPTTDRKRPKLATVIDISGSGSSDVAPLPPVGAKRPMADLLDQVSSPSVDSDHPMTQPRGELPTTLVGSKRPMVQDGPSGEACVTKRARTVLSDGSIIVTYPASIPPKKASSVEVSSSRSDSALRKLLPDGSIIVSHPASTPPQGTSSVEIRPSRSESAQRRASEAAARRRLLSSLSPQSDHEDLPPATTSAPAPASASAPAPAPARRRAVPLLRKRRGSANPRPGDSRDQVANAFFNFQPLSIRHFFTTFKLPLPSQPPNFSAMRLLYKPLVRKLSRMPLRRYPERNLASLDHATRGASSGFSETRLELFLSSRAACLDDFWTTPAFRRALLPHLTPRSASTEPLLEKSPARPSMKKSKSPNAEVSPPEAETKSALRLTPSKHFRGTRMTDFFSRTPSNGDAVTAPVAAASVASSGGGSSPPAPPVAVSSVASGSGQKSPPAPLVDVASAASGSAGSHDITTPVAVASVAGNSGGSSPLAPPVAVATVASDSGGDAVTTPKAVASVASGRGRNSPPIPPVAVASVARGSGRSSPPAPPVAVASVASGQHPLPSPSAASTGDVSPSPLSHDMTHVSAASPSGSASQNITATAATTPAPSTVSPSSRALSPTRTPARRNSPQLPPSSSHRHRLPRAQYRRIQSSSASDSSSVYSDRDAQTSTSKLQNSSTSKSERSSSRIRKNAQHSSSNSSSRSSYSPPVVDLSDVSAAPCLSSCSPSLRREASDLTTKRAKSLSDRKTSTSKEPSRGKRPSISSSARRVSKPSRRKDKRPTAKSRALTSGVSDDGRWHETSWNLDPRRVETLSSMEDVDGDFWSSFRTAQCDSDSDADANADRNSNGSETLAFRLPDSIKALIHGADPAYDSDDTSDSEDETIPRYHRMMSPVPRSDKYCGLPVRKAIDCSRKRGFLLECSVTEDSATALISAQFDCRFNGCTRFYLPGFPSRQEIGEFSFGFVTGQSGSGKTQLVRHNFQKHWPTPPRIEWHPNRSIASHFDSAEVARSLLSLVALEPSRWFLPFDCLSHSEQESAILARKITRDGEVIDEFTSFSDRDNAKLVARNVSEFLHARRCKRVVFMGCHEDLLGTDMFHPAWHFDTNTKVFRFFDPPAEKKRKSASNFASTHILSSSPHASHPSKHSTSKQAERGSSEPSQSTPQDSLQHLPSEGDEPEIPFGKREVVDSASDGGSATYQSHSTVTSGRAENAREGKDNSTPRDDLYWCDSTGNHLSFSWSPPKLLVVLHKAKLAAWNLFKEHHYLSQQVNSNSTAFVAVMYEASPRSLSSAAPMNPQLMGIVCATTHFGGRTAVTNLPRRREHRTVVLPQFQGLGLGSRISDAIAYVHYLKNYEYYSKTAHPRFGAYRDHSELWAPTIANHKVQKLPTIHRVLLKNHKDKDNKIYRLPAMYRDLKRVFMPKTYYAHRFEGPRSSKAQNFVESRIRVVIPTDS